MNWPIGVFASVDAGLGVHLDVARELNIPSIQVHTPHAHNRTAEAASKFLERCVSAGVTITCVFGGFEEDSYASISEAARTVGLVPPETRQARANEMKGIAEFARWLGCDAVGLHIGFVPEDRQSADYEDLLLVTRDLLDHLALHKQFLHLETGQETADHLLHFIHDVNRHNLAINFDPANMILYGTGEPIEALKKVGKYVRSVHCKDATWAEQSQRGKAWGKEVPLGQGDVGMKQYLQTLKEIGYDGPLTIEREIPENREAQQRDVGAAVQLLKKTMKELC
jgi:sugar phosphate isomerase/epimerase